MQIRFRGGPYDGQVREIDEVDAGAVIYWPPDASPTIGDPDVPGVEGVVEYIARGDGTADYVGGVPAP